MLALLNEVNAEDKPVIEAARRNANGRQFARGPLSYLERNVYDFDRYIARALVRVARSRPHHRPSQSD